MAYDEELALRIQQLVASEAGLTTKRMFGGLAFLIGGHLAVAASSKGGLLVRVEPGRTDDLLAQPGVQPMEMRGRAMTGWLRVHDDGTEIDDDTLRRWVDEGTGYARTLPPK